MKAVDAQWISVNYAADNGAQEQRQLSRVRIAVHATGSVMSGVVVQFIYEAAPAQSARYERKDDGSAVIESEPVTASPHHWYWQRIDR